MKYFKIKAAIEDSIVGTYPQSLKMTKDYFIKRGDSIWKMDIHSDISPNLNGIQLEQSAIPTDLLSVVPISPIHGLIVSEEFMKISQRLNLPPHRFFEARIFDFQNNEIPKKYFLFRLLSFQNDWISFNRSEFVVTNLGMEIESLDIRNTSDLENLPPDVCMDMHPKIISLTRDFQLDIFYFSKIGGYFCSKRFRDSFMTKSSGIRFEPANFIVQKEIVLSA